MADRQIPNDLKRGQFSPSNVTLEENPVRTALKMMADRFDEKQSDEWDHWDDWDTPFPPAIYDETTAADLEQTLRDFDQIQADLSYQDAQTSLKTLVQGLDLTDPEQQGLETELQQLQVMLDKIEQQVVHIAVFGMVSRGKSSLLNALLGQPVFATGPLHGVTRNRQQASWHIEPTLAGTNAVRVSLPGSGQSRIELIDTPGLDEIDGETREILARDIAQQADLILFVAAGDITRIEYDALADLRQASKPMLLVFNK
ncbi:MAG: Era-like GTP-binding protein, partial [Thermosynechococcaceae cyanobacterium]